MVECEGRCELIFKRTHINVTGTGTMHGREIIQLNNYGMTIADPEGPAWTAANSPRIEENGSSATKTSRVAASFLKSIIKSEVLRINDVTITICACKAYQY